MTEVVERRERVVGPSPRTTVRRYPHRAAYDRPTIDTILDEGIVCHVGLRTEGGFPVVMPLCYGRSGDTLFLHGSAASRLFRGARGESVEVCATVTLIDGIVVARSSYNTDVNYRCVVIIGNAVEVTDPDEKRAGLNVLVDHVIDGRSRDSRAPTDQELKATMLLALPITEASAKVRSGWPNDERDDYALPIWAGVVPLSTVAGAPLDDPDLAFDLPAPAYVTSYTR